MLRGGEWGASTAGLVVGVPRFCALAGERGYFVAIDCLHGGEVFVVAGLSRGEREAKMRGIAVRAEYAAFMGECERLGVSVGGNAENKYMVFRRTLVRDDAALRGGDGLGGEGAHRCGGAQSAGSSGKIHRHNLSQNTSMFSEMHLG